MAVSNNNLVVLVTTFNRKDITLRCLRSLYDAAQEAEIQLEVVVVDANSPDQTGIAIAKEFPGVRLISADSQTYWAQGMRKSWEVARQVSIDADVLWLNDDVVLMPNTLKELQRDVLETSRRSIIVGALIDPKTSETSYSGYKLGGVFSRLSFKKVRPIGARTTIDAANGNLVWIPRDIANRLGGFPEGYVHGIADNAYTLNAKKLGITSLLTANHVAFCESNPNVGSWQDPKLSPRERFKLLISPKGLPPRQYVTFCFSFGGITGPIYAFKPYISLGMQALFSKNEISRIHNLHKCDLKSKLKSEY